MPTLNFTISLPTQDEVDDFLISHGKPTTGDKAQSAKEVIVRFVVQSIKSKRISEVAERERLEIKTIEDSTLDVI
jgi:hypothetical protein